MGSLAAAVGTKLRGILSQLQSTLKIASSLLPESSEAKANATFSGDFAQSSPRALQMGADAAHQVHTTVACNAPDVVLTGVQLADGLVEVEEINTHALKGWL